MRSSHNVGSLLRTAEGLGVARVYLTGYTPHPEYNGDPRLPHLARKQTTAISKTALGAEDQQSWCYMPDVRQVIGSLRASGYEIVALEQTLEAIALPDYAAPRKVAVLLGREVEGVEPELLKLCSQKIVIPMFGVKESFNVVQSAAMVLYHLRFS